ncbi:MAG: type II toxin-antitoxin system VapC family toxin [Verrucomicrobiae bacterium]|nr:type II toxin-antitoxin system VapC family toxin [Verrucomicrobiae bacterium]
MPASNSLLLDTSVVIAFFRNEPTVVATLTNMDSLYLPLVALGELNLGLERAQNKARAKRALEELLSFVNVLYPDLETATLYGRIKAKLMADGNPIPDNDIWIAATALQTGLPLATRDAHFDHVDEITKLHV